jgi:hypothetical protein
MKLIKRFILFHHIIKIKEGRNDKIDLKYMIIYL